jgi:hypothetical protein
VKTTHTINHYLLDQFTKIFSVTPASIQRNEDLAKRKYSEKEIELLNNILTDIKTVLKNKNITFSTESTTIQKSNCPIHEFISSIKNLIRHTENIKICRTNSSALFKQRSPEQWIAIRNELLHLGIQQASCEFKYVNSLTYFQQHIQRQYDCIKTLFNCLYETIQKTITKHLTYLDERPIEVYLTTSERCFYTKVNQLMERLTTLYVDEHFIQNAFPSPILSPNKKDISLAIMHIDYYLHSHNQKHSIKSQHSQLFKEKTKDKSSNPSNPVSFRQ